MIKTIRYLFAVISIFSITTLTAQTVVNTALAGGTILAGTSGFITFGVKNNNATTISISEIAIYHNTANNGKTYTVWYTTTALTGIPNVTVAAWTQLGTSAAITLGASANTTLLSGLNIILPASGTIRFAVVVNTGSIYSSTTGVNSYTNGNVEILTGSNAASPTYVGIFPAGSTTPRYYPGSITFNMVNNDMGSLPIAQPANNSQICFNTPLIIKGVIKNLGGVAQTNIPVGLRYTGPGGITTYVNSIYTGTLASAATDTVYFGPLLLNSGLYTAKVFTNLAGDSYGVNDSSSGITFTILPAVPLPGVHSDTVCFAQTSTISITQASGTTYNWYSTPTAVTPTVTGITTIVIPSLVADSLMYVTAIFGGCESARTLINAHVAPHPVVNLPNDTIFCEATPLILNAGNPGGKYIWSTGDTTQTISVTNISATYWVQVNKYCIESDTVDVTVNPSAKVNGISYIRAGGTYNFSPAMPQNVDDYLWIFGDGITSTLMSPVHTYATSVTTNLIVKLVVSNECGPDTVTRMVPTSVNGIENEESTVQLYPNPATDVLHISSEHVKPEEISILNMQGVLIFRQPLNKNQTNQSIRLPHLATGQYIINLRTSSGTIHKPLMIAE